MRLSLIHISASSFSLLAAFFASASAWLVNMDFTGLSVHLPGLAMNALISLAIGRLVPTTPFLAS